MRVLFEIQPSSEGCGSVNIAARTARLAFQARHSAPAGDPLPNRVRDKVWLRLERHRPVSKELDVDVDQARRYFELVRAQLVYREVRGLSLFESRL